MTERDVQNWLEKYGRAWVNGDPDQAVALFADTAMYRETPFDDPMRGRDQIRNYWQEGAADTQESVAFSSQVWAILDHAAIVGWQAHFRRKPSGVRVELDGVFRLGFSRKHGILQCTSFEEWWHRRES